MTLSQQPWKEKVVLTVPRNCYGKTSCYKILHTFVASYFVTARYFKIVVEVVSKYRGSIRVHIMVMMVVQTHCTARSSL